jgi:hypothetical protein
MEESLCRDNNRNQSSCGELEVPSRWFSFSVYSWFGCKRSSLFT